MVISHHSHLKGKPRTSKPPTQGFTEVGLPIKVHWCKKHDGKDRVQGICSENLFEPCSALKIVGGSSLDEYPLPSDEKDCHRRQASSRNFCKLNSKLKLQLFFLSSKIYKMRLYSAPKKHFLPSLQVTAFLNFLNLWFQ